MLNKMTIDTCHFWSLSCQFCVICFSKPPCFHNSITESRNL